MTEMMIENGMIIDDVESVVSSIKALCSVELSDFETVKKFITQEKNTKFYVDAKLNSYMLPMKDCIYIWLDTGFVDRRGNAIMISLLKTWDGFVGHVVGTIKTLSESVSKFFKLSRENCSKKMLAIKKKYESKLTERDNKHIHDEGQYLLSSCRAISEKTLLAEKLAELHLEFDEDIEAEDIVVAEQSGIEEKLTEQEEAMTIGLLLEKMESMQKHMDELLFTIEKLGSESSTKIEELQKKNEEYRRAIVQMRTFSQMGEVTDEEDAEVTGHNLLGEHKKILIIGGQELGVNVMQGIAKTYGFDKKDFEYIDYDKAKNQLVKIKKEGRYRAVIFGACPHKTSGCAGYSSALEKIRQEMGMPLAVDARNKSGKLKVTKESFRLALVEVINDMKMAYAV